MKVTSKLRRAKNEDNLKNEDDLKIGDDHENEYTKPNLPNQTYQTKPAKSNQSNQSSQAFESKPTKPNSPTQAYQQKRYQSLTSELVEQCQLSKENNDTIKVWQVKACPERGTAQPHFASHSKQYSDGARGLFFRAEQSRGFL